MKKLQDRTEKPVVFALWIKPQTKGFHEFILFCCMSLSEFVVVPGDVNESLSKFALEVLKQLFHNSYGLDSFQNVQHNAS